MASKVTKVLTGITGLPVCAKPHAELAKHYYRLLRRLEDLPKESKYRINVEQLVKQRIEIVESTPDPKDIEKKIGCGMCEELIEDTKLEIDLVQTMKEYKPWEPLVERPSPDQWKWPC